ncbi:MAG: hypothetical protein QOE24_776 [Frankiales bacterium]|nr:hypothetical protein [Frankiales bacterium]
MTPDLGPGQLLVRPLVEERQLTLLVLGEADFSTAVGLHRQLVEAMAGWPYTVVIDVSGLSFCGLAGLDALREAELVGVAAGRDVRVTGMSRQLSWLRRTFGGTGSGESPLLAESGPESGPKSDIVRSRRILDERS